MVGYHEVEEVVGRLCHVKGGQVRVGGELWPNATRRVAPLPLCPDEKLLEDGRSVGERQ
jgi:hypothetical protein